MPGRNDACPCGSGKKYKKCCLESDNVRRRVAAVGDQFEERFFEAVDSVHIDAIRCQGLNALETWSRPYQGGNAEFEVDLFKSFVACHVPFKGATSLAHWVLNYGRLEESERQVLIETLTIPFSLWVVEEIVSGVATVRDLLLGGSRKITLAGRNSDCEPGQVMYGKVVDWQGSLFLLTPGPVRVSEEVAGIVLRLVLGKRKAMSYLELMEPDVQGGLFTAWCSTFRRLIGENTSEDSLPAFPDHHQLRYAFEPGARSRVVKALGASSVFAKDGPHRYLYPGKGEVEAVLDLTSGSLTVNATRVPRIEVLKEALQGALGDLVSLHEHQTVNLMEHLLEHGLHHPLLPGLPAMADALSPAEMEIVERAVERLRGTKDDQVDAGEEEFLRGSLGSARLDAESKNPPLNY